MRLEGHITRPAGKTGAPRFDLRSFGPYACLEPQQSASIMQLGVAGR